MKIKFAIVSALTFSLLFIGLSNALAVEKIKFSSAYTNLSKDCKWAFKDSDLQEGQDNSLSCRGYGGNALQIDFTASDAVLMVVKKGSSDGGMANFTIADYKKGMVEWRMANGKPFAIIVRALGENAAKVIAVSGLQGFESINTKLDSKKANANQAARDYADGEYTKLQKH
jgi:hypothetical protein